MTIVIDRELHTRLKVEAAKQHMTIGKLVEKIFNRATFDLSDYPNPERKFDKPLVYKSEGLPKDVRFDNDKV